MCNANMSHFMKTLNEKGGRKQRLKEMMLMSETISNSLDQLLFNYI